VAVLGVVGLLLGPGGAPAQAASSAPNCEVAMVAGCQPAAPAEEPDRPVDGTGDDEDRAVNTGNDTREAVTLGAGIDGSGAVIDPWRQGGLETNFGTDSIPLHHYQIGADTGGRLGVPDPIDSFVASQTNWVFTTTTFLVAFATNSLDWAFEFDLANGLVDDAGIMAQRYTLDLFGFGLSTSLYRLALTMSIIVAAFQAVTRSVLVAGVEIGQTFAAYVLVIVLTVGSGFGDVGLSVARLSTEVSRTIAVFGTGENEREACAEVIASERNPPELAGRAASTAELSSVDYNDALARSQGAAAACSFGHALQRSLIELPYQNLQWGQVLDGVEGKEACAELNLVLLAERPWGNDDEPRNRMAAIPECQPNADFNAQATAVRLGIAVSTLLTTFLVTVLVLVVSALLLWQQIKLLFLTVLMPHALVFAMLPGRPRSLAWSWAEQMAGVLVRTVVLAIGLVVWLSLFSLVVFEQLSVQGTFVSLFASATMALAGYYGLYRMSGVLGIFLPRFAPRWGRRDGGEERPTRRGGAGGVTAVPVAALPVAAVGGTTRAAAVALRTVRRHRDRRPTETV
jgi:hypothetical protein